MKKNNIIKLSLATILSLQIGVLAETNKNTLESIDIVSEIEKEKTYTVETMGTSTGFNLSIKDTPQSITVITKDELDDLGIKTYDELLTHISGVTLNRWDERVEPIARGFKIDYFKIDGMPVYVDVSSRTLDLSIYERVEVVRGANGLTTGSGNPAISLNFIRKRANSTETTGSIIAGIDSEGSAGLTADISGAITDDGTVRARVVAKTNNGESFIDGYENDTDLLYGIIDVDLNDNTKVSLGASYEKSDKSGVRWGGLPSSFGDGTDTNFDVSKSLSEDWTYTNSEKLSIFTDLEHHFSNDMLLTASYSHEKSSAESALLYYGYYSLASSFYYIDYTDESEEKIDDINVNLNIPFKLGGYMQEAIIGVNYNKSESWINGRYPNGQNETFNAVLVSSLDNDVPDITSENSSTDNYYIVKPEEVEQKSIYLSSKLQLNEIVKVIAGARLSSYEYTSTDSSKESREFSRELSPYLGVILDLNQEISLYTSFTTIFKPQELKDSSGNYLDPVYGNTFEVGIKGEFFDKDLSTTLSVFQTKQDNAGEDTGKLLGTQKIYKAVDGVTSEGFELDVIGKLTDTLTLSFGLANFEAKDADGEKFNTKASRTSSNLFLKYKYDKFTFGGGLNYNSKRYDGDVVQDGYYIANAMFGYKFNKNLSSQVNVSNIFDKKYYEGFDSSSYHFGAPRGFTAQLKYTF